MLRTWSADSGMISGMSKNSKSWDVPEKSSSLSSWVCLVLGTVLSFLSFLSILKKSLYHTLSPFCTVQACGVKKPHRLKYLRLSRGKSFFHSSVLSYTSLGILVLETECYLCFRSRECRERRGCFRSQREVQSIMAGEWRQQELEQLLASKECTHGSAQLVFSIYEIQDPW